MVHGYIEESLDLGGVEIERHDTVRAGALEQTRNELRGNGNTRLVFTVLTAITVIRKHSGDPFGGRALQGIDEQEQLHEVPLDGGAGGLEHENIGASNV